MIIKTFWDVMVRVVLKLKSLKQDIYRYVANTNCLIIV